MMFKQLLARVFFGTRNSVEREAQAVSGRLSSAAAIRDILERERIRSDRTGDPLTLVIFASRDDETAEATCARLVSLLQFRLRCTDEPGWWTQREICVVLPHTTVQGAWAFADDICARFSDDGVPPHCTVYAYPWKNENNGNGAEVVNVKVAEPIEQLVQPLEALFVADLPWWKRGLDIVLAAVGLIMLLPVFGVISVALKLTTRGPVFFKQRRSGQGGTPFTLYKFRTMVLDAEARKKDLIALNEQDGAAFKIRNDPRVTRLGRILRKTSLDELPQLWNILRGEMTLVGPRPLPCAETEACQGWQRRRLEATPGLTCIWQVRGRGGVPFADWIRMDLEYIRSRSLWHDLKLLFLTVPAVLLRRGAH
jgi:lipopolysaccharide/colanic/teichoic acid biosynthesis glycosyltransferase